MACLPVRLRSAPAHLAGIFFALAAAPALAVGGDQNAETPVRSDEVASIATSLPDRGDPTGARAFLESRGVKFGAIYTGEVLANVSGGIRRGSAFTGKLELNTTWDLARLVGLPGLTFYANGFQIHPTSGISRNYVGNIQTISNIEALPANRLSELWVEQKLFDGRLGIRVGQLAVDTEFAIAGYSLPFLDSDWPAIAKQNLPGGGPAYPLAAPGARVRFDPTPQVSVLGAIFNGDPGGRSRGDKEAESRNRSGTRFPLDERPLMIQELQLRWNQASEATGLAGDVRFGAWQHLGTFQPQRGDAARLSTPASAADTPQEDGTNPGAGSGGGVPAAGASLSSGATRLLRGNWGIYGILDQQIYRLPGGDANSGVTAFGRVSASPSDRNLVRFYLDGGLLFTGLVPGRPNDVFGATALWSELSSDARAFDRQTVAATGIAQPIRDREIAIELTYVAQVRPGWSIQPDLQYIIHPGGNVANPRSPTGQAIKDATILGLRTTIVY